jgi:hypothetical protein
MWPFSQVFKKSWAPGFPAASFYKFTPWGECLPFFTPRGQQHPTLLKNSGKKGQRLPGGGAIFSPGGKISPLGKKLKTGL